MNTSMCTFGPVSLFILETNAFYGMEIGPQISEARQSTEKCQLRQQLYIPEVFAEQR